MGKIYACAGLGGTFDHFHAGHRQFIEFAARTARHLVIGITDEKMIKSKLFSNSIELLNKRVKNVTKFLNSLHLSFETVILHDLYGITLEDKRITSLVATNETLSSCEKINEARAKLRLSNLPIELCPMVLDHGGEELHSDRIRAGLVNREGLVYQKLWEKSIAINDQQRQFFAKEQGKIVEQPMAENKRNEVDKRLASPTIVVGDATLTKFSQNHWTFDVAVFDRQIQRQKFNSPIPIDEKIVIIENPAGRITPQLGQSLFSLIQDQSNWLRPKYLEINGEEDLATVVAVLSAPLSSYVYYGQPNRGLVEILVNEQIKEKFAKALT